MSAIQLPTHAPSPNCQDRYFQAIEDQRMRSSTFLATDEIAVIRDSFRSGPVEYVQTGKGLLNAEMFSVRSPAVEIREVSFQAGTLLTCESVFPRFAMGVALAGSPSLMGSKLTGSSLGFLNGRNGLVARHAAGSAWCNIAIDHQFLRDTADLHGYSLPDGDGACALPNDVIARFAGTLSGIAHGSLGTELDDRVFEEDIALRVLQVLNLGQARERQSSAGQWRTSRLVIEYIHAHYHEPITLSDLCRYSGVGERTLRYHFRKACDLSIQDYLMDYRLQRAYALLARGRVSTVGDVARSCGIPDAGRFAQYFRRHFGILPRTLLE